MMVISDSPSSPALAHPFRARALAVLCGLSLLPAGLHANAPEYIKAADSSFSWKLEKTIVVAESTVSFIHLTSQTWKSVPWRHWLSILRPANLKNTAHALLVIAGGKRRETPPSGLPLEALVLAKVAQKTGTVIALLEQVPYQPLFNGLREDGLIAYTFQKYLETGDESWPCLLPMTKSAIRAMDTVQAFLRQNHHQEMKKFTVTGASKRGWTAWLTAASDPRVVAIAPMVIDTLNMAKQMPHHVKCWGTYSDEIEDYTRLRLPERLSEPETRRLLEIVDPYSYRKSLTMPKLIIIGTNDRYWPVDSIKHYFDDLPGEKYIHYTPNAGHGLGSGLAAVHAISAFYQSVINQEPRPRFTWKLTRGEGEALLTINAEDAPVSVKLWKATSADRDFRDERWTSFEVAPDGKIYRLRTPLPAESYVAFYGSLVYESSLGHVYSLATNVEVLEPARGEETRVTRENAASAGSETRQ